jgi:hypothetical protein
MMQNLDIPIEGSGRAATGATRRRRIIFHQSRRMSIAPWTLKTNWCAPELSSCPKWKHTHSKELSLQGTNRAVSDIHLQCYGGGATGMFLPKGAN